MVNYLVEYEKKNLMIPSSKPHGPYNFNVPADNIKQAVLIAASELYEIGMKSCNNDVWNASLYDSSKTKYAILQNGGWLIDHKTGKFI